MNAQALQAVGQPQTPENLLAIAVDKGASVEQLEKLMALQERWQAQQARMAYFSALARFQATVPPIPKARKVEYNRTSYSFAALEDIANAIRQPAQDCGLSYRWEVADSGESLTVTCIVTHTEGHSERTTMSAAPDDSGAKNLIQQRGSAVTYLQRYTLIGALGLTTAQDDDDGKSSGNLNVEDIIAHNEVVRQQWFNIHDIKAGLLEGGHIQRAAEAWADMTEDVKRALWKAPSKGGIFTTEERKAIHGGSSEFAAALAALRNGPGGIK